MTSDHTEVLLFDAESERDRFRERAEAAEAQLAEIEARRSDIRRALEFAARNTVADEQAERYAEAWEGLEPGGAGFDVTNTGTEEPRHV